MQILNNYVSESLMRGATVFEDRVTGTIHVHFFEDGEELATASYDEASLHQARKDGYDWVRTGELPN